MHPPSSKPSKPSRPQTSPQGGGFTLPLLPPYRSGSLITTPSWRPRLPLDLKILCENVFNLLMGPFGSDQSHHVDDFDAKQHNFDDSAAKKVVMLTTFGEESEFWWSVLPHSFIKPLKYVGNMNVSWKQTFMYPMWLHNSQSGPKVMQSHFPMPKITPKWTQSKPKVTLKWSQSRAKMT